MVRKSDNKKKKAESDLTPEESLEVQMILDRLSVQVPDGESFQVYLKSLRNMLARREKLVVALLSQLSKSPSPVGVRAYRVLEDLVVDKGARKILRQVSYRFVQKGYPLDAGEQVQEKVVLVQKEQKRAVAHLTIGSGTLWLLSALVPDERTGWATMIIAFFDGGFEKFVVRATETSNKGYRDFMVKVGGTVPEGKPREIPVKHGARLFHDMVEFSRDPTPPPELEEVRRLIAPFHDPEAPPYIHTLMGPCDDISGRIRELDAGALLSKLDLRWLLFPKDDLLPFHQRLEDLTHSVLFVPDDIKGERYQGALRNAAASLCAGKTRLLYRRFFEEQALWSKLHGKDDEAEAAFLIALHLGSDRDAGENPAVIQMVVESLHHHWPQKEKTDEPDEAPEPFYRTDSGLFVPR